MSTSTVLGLLGALLLLFVLSACGGGGAGFAQEGRNWALFIGSSDIKGGYIDMSASPPTIRQYEPDPVEMIQAALGDRLLCVNAGMNGRKLQELIDGGTLSMEPNEVTPSLEQILRDEKKRRGPPDVVYLGTGMVDVAYTHIMLDDYLYKVGKTIDIVREVFNDQAAEPAIVLGGFIGFQLSVHNAALMTPAMVRRLDQFDRATEDLAGRYGVRYMSMAGAGAPETIEDGMHPTPNYHERLAAWRARNIAEWFPGLIEPVNF